MGTEALLLTVSGMTKLISAGKIRSLAAENPTETLNPSTTDGSEGKGRAKGPISRGGEDTFGSSSSHKRSVTALGN